MPLNVKQVPYTNFYGSIVASATSIPLNADCNGKIFRYEGSGNVTVTVPASLPVGFNVGFVMYGSGTITLASGGGAVNRSGKTVLGTQYQSGSVLVVKNNAGLTAAEYLVGGDFA